MFLPCLSIFLSVFHKNSWKDERRKERNLSVYYYREKDYNVSPSCSVWLAGCPAGTFGSVTCHRIYC